MEVISQKSPRARKNHHCSLCHRLIGAGETYTRQVSVSDGRIWTFRECAHCARLDAEIGLAWLEDPYGGEGYTEETVLNWEPETIHEARLKIGWRRKWRHRDGTLYHLRGGRIIV